MKYLTIFLIISTSYAAENGKLLQEITEISVKNPKASKQELEQKRVNLIKEDHQKRIQKADKMKADVDKMNKEHAKIKAPVLEESPKAKASGKSLADQKAKSGDKKAAHAIAPSTAIRSKSTGAEGGVESGGAEAIDFGKKSN